jgi:hypothetical protein
MIPALSVLFVLAIAYSQYSQAKRNGQWSWAGFFVILGSMLGFAAAFLIPVVQSTKLQARPGLMVAVILTGNVLFVAALIYACRRYYMRGPKAKPSSAPATGDASIGKSLAPIVVMVCIFATTAQIHAQGKRVYKDPGGAFSVSVPAGWDTQPQQGSPMISIVNAKSKVSVTLGVMRGPAANTPSAQKELQGIQAQFPQSCPKAKIESQGPTTLAGLSGQFMVVHCLPAEGPQLMKFTAASKPGVVALMVTASPGNAYLKELVPLMEISGSLRVLGPTGPMPGGAMSGSPMPGGQMRGGAMSGAQTQGGAMPASPAPGMPAGQAPQP